MARRKHPNPAIGGGAVTAAPAEASAAPTSLVQITRLVEGGGQIMIGTVQPVSGSVAVAHDGKKTLAMLRRQPGEKIEDLIGRLDRSIAAAKRRGIRVDEVNDPNGDIRYEL